MPKSSNRAHPIDAAIGLLLLPLLLLTVSCAHHPAARPPVAEQKAAGDAIVLPTRQTHTAQREEWGSSSTRAGFTDVVFVSYEPAALRKGKNQYVFRPAVAIKRSPKRAAEFASWPELTGYDWVSAAQLESKNYYWGFLDQMVEGAGSEVLVVWSQDGGRSWSQLPSLPKNYFADEFHSFVMDEQGKGYAVLKRSGESLDARRGFDLFSTSDFGKSWSEASYVPSDIVNAENLDPDCAFEMTPHKKIPSECALPSGF